MARRTARRLEPPAPEPPSLPPRLLRRQGAAHYINQSPAYVDALVLQGELRPVRLPATRGGGANRVPLFDRVDLDQFIERMKAAAGGVS